MRKDRPDIIFVTAPPFSVLIGGLVAKAILQKPLVSDFRDEWVGWLAGSAWSHDGNERRMSYAIERCMEHSVIMRSDIVTSASPGYIQGFKEKYGERAGRCVCITNGYDADDLKVITKHIKGHSKGPMNIVYMGTVFPKQNSLKYFLDGINNIDLSKNINITIVGRITLDEESCYNEYKNLRITKLDYCPHEEAIAIAAQADMLLVTLSPVRGAEKIIPAKIFEYMALRKHIIAVIPAGSAGDILKRYSGSIIIDPLDKKAIARNVQELYARWVTKSLPAIEDDVVEHSRDSKAKELCALFNTL